MKTRFNKLTAWLLTLAMLMTFIPSFTLTASAAETYDLWVGGEQFTSEKLEILDGNGGKATYEPDDKTLTLNNYTFSGDGYNIYNEVKYAAIYYGGTDMLNLVLEGNSTVTQQSDAVLDDSYGIFSQGSITVSGDGSLTVNSGSADYESIGVYINGDAVIVSDGKLSANAGTANDYSNGLSLYGSFSISGGTVEAHGGTADISYGIDVYVDVNVSGGSVTATGDTANEESYGVNATGNITVTGGSLTATGGEATTESGRSCGVFGDDYNISVSGTGKLKAEGGAAAESDGIFALFGSIAVSDSGILTANGGASTKSRGIKAQTGTITISDNGILTANAGVADDSCGVDVSEYGSINVVGGSLRAAGKRYGVYNEYYGTITLSGGETIAQGETSAFYSAPTIDDTFANAAVWSGTDETQANIEGEQPINELMFLYIKKYVKIAEGTPAPSYDIIVNNSENGTVEADVTEATEGDTVTLTVTPDNGFEIDTVSYNDGTNNVEIVAVGDAYSFTMPASDVTVSATFKLITEYTINWSGPVDVENTPKFDLMPYLPEDISVERVSIVALPNILSGFSPTYSTNMASVKLTTRVFDEPCSETVNIVAESSNYPDITFKIVVSLTGKYIITIKADAQNALYDGYAHIGFENVSGTLSNGNPYEGTYTYSYETTDGTPLDGAPTEVGDYKVTIAVPENDETYKGSVTVEFSILAEPQASYQSEENSEWKNGTFTEALANVYDGGTVKLLSDVILDSTVVIFRNVTITSANTDNVCTITTETDAHGYLLNVTADVTLENIIVDGGSENGLTANRALIAVNGGKLNIGSGAVVRNNNNTTSSGIGGGVCLITGELVLDGGEICGNTGDFGGGVGLAGGTFTAKSGSITENSAKMGGGVCVWENGGNVGTMNVTGNVSISENTAEYYGGGVNCHYNGSVTLSSNPVISNNTSPEETNGGIYLDGNRDDGHASIYVNGLSEGAEVSFYTWLKSEGLLISKPAGDYTISDSDIAKMKWNGDDFVLARDNDGNVVLAYPPVIYNVTLNANGGTINSGEITSYIAGKETALPTDVSKKGHGFAGWYENEKFTGSAVTRIESTDTGDKEYFAKWEVLKYPVTFNAGNGAFSTGSKEITIDVEFGTVPVAPETPALAGYAFADWQPALAPVTVEGATYTASYAPNDVRYTIEIYTMDTTGAYGEPDTEPKTAKTDSIVSVTPEAKEGFTVDADASVLSDTAEADGSTVLKVYYMRNQYNLTIEVDGVEDSKAYYYGETVEAPTAPTKTGYTFEGWDKDIPTTMPAWDVSITAVFIPCDHSLRYAINDAEDTIIATCQNNCGYTGTATISAVNATYDGTAKEATVTYSDNWQGGELAITYSEGGNINAGSVTASIEKDGVKASVEYTIQPIELEPSDFEFPYTSRVYDGTANAGFVDDNFVWKYGGNILFEDTDKIYISLQAFFDTADVGDNKTITISNIVLRGVEGRGDASGNYRAPDSFTIPGSITPKDITEADVRLNGTLSYTGSEQTQQITVTDGIEYTVTGNMATDVGTYTLTVTASGNYTGSVPKQWSIGKAAAAFTAAPTANELTYTGEAQELVKGGTANGGRVVYSLNENGEFTETIPTGLDAGDYTVWYYVKGDDNHTDSTKASVTATITPKPITGATVGAFAELTYTGVEQEPFATVTIDNHNVTGTWSNVTNVADKTTFTADGNFTGTIADKETGMLPADSSVATAPSANTLTYSATAQELVTTGVANGGTLKYSLDNATWVDAIPTGTNAGTYEVWYKVFGDANHNETEAVKVDVSIAKKTIENVIVLTAPVKNTTPQTEITGDGYTATVEWSPVVTDKFGYNTEYTATIAITVDDNHTVTGIEADGYTVEGAKTVTNEENSNVVTVAYEKTGSRPSSGGGSSNTTTTTTKNEDGSTTKTTTNKSTGTVTEVTTNTDGSTTTVETKKDGTVTTTEKDKDGNTTTTVEKSDGTSTTTEKNKDGSEKVTENKADGTTVTTEKDTDGTKTVTTENADGSTKTEETKKDGTKVTTQTSADGETKTEIVLPKDKETEVTIPVDSAEDVTSIIVTDKDGKETEITDFEITEDGVKVIVSGDCTAVINKAAKKEFEDVHPVNHWATADIDYAYIKGLMMGTSETHFSPDVPLTRAMLVTVLYRLEGEPATNRSIPFADVDMGAYYGSAVSWAKQNGIVNGVTENEFAPNDNITREQIAAIMHRYAQYKGYDVTQGGMLVREYDDYEAISDYALSSMTWAVNAGILKGKGNNSLAPQDNATRAEVAAILHRFIEANK